jgi:phosphoenolpyruvate carboxykinase (GTP)
MKIKHEKLKKWVDECAKLCQPDKIVWLDGSPREKKRLEDEACKTGELIRLDQKKLPGCFYHRSAPNDVARTEHLTFICTPTKDEAGPTNNWMAPAEGYKKAREFFKGSMKGRTMYVVPFSMGLVDSPFSKIGIQLTDSIYVALNMRIMTNMGEKVYKKLGTSGEFTKCLHSKADLDIKKRLILHFPRDNTIWSVGSGYGGNALLGKKCLALRVASYLGQKEGWLAEHMLVMGVEDPQGHITYIAAAFPSACGKTNLAMLVPPERFRKMGYKVWTLGDDIAWLRVDEEGVLRAVNPEAGYFGVVPGTNSKTNPNAVIAMRKNTIFTNVLLKKDKTVWWEHADEPAPEEGIDWQGHLWKPGTRDEDGKALLGAHPNSRFTAPINQNPAFSNRYYDPRGVRIDAILFGGRRSRVAPLVYEARSWQHGVYVGATMASEKTAAAMGSVGDVRRDPMAMLPFCGYNMGTYFKHWIEMGRKMVSPPKIFRVNWFRQDDKGNYLWPGFGENMRVLLWIINRCRYQVPAKAMPVGYIPYRKDFDVDGIDMPEPKWRKLFDINKTESDQELKGQKEFFDQFGSNLPEEFTAEWSDLNDRILGSP